MSEDNIEKDYLVAKYRDQIKIKYLIGQYRDREDFPTREDFLFLANHWYHAEDGKSFIHDYRGIDNTNNVIFPGDKILEKLDGKEDEMNLIIDGLIENGQLKINKNTKFTTYYEII